MWLSRRQYRTALAWQIGLAAYMQLISWVPLGRWNDQPCCPPGLELFRRGTLSPSDAIETAAFLLPVALFSLGAWREWRWAMWVAILATAVWLGLQLATWWPPYLFGASEQWSKVYERAFARATPILPRWGHHLPPDAMHVVLQVLLSGTVATGTMALLRRPQHRRSTSPAPPTSGARSPR
jgi:hypothetical protein